MAPALPATAVSPESGARTQWPVVVLPPRGSASGGGGGAAEADGFPASFAAGAVVAPAGVLLTGSCGAAMNAWVEAPGEKEHGKLRQDLSEHVLENKAVLLQPHL